jgi:hypothetical protein
LTVEFARGTLVPPQLPTVEEEIEFSVTRFGGPQGLGSGQREIA